MVEFKEIPNIVKTLIVIIILLVIGALIFVGISDSNVLPDEAWTNETTTAAANGTTAKGFRVTMPADNIKSLTYITLANTTNTSFPHTLTSDNYTLYAAQGYIDVISNPKTVGMFAGQELNITGEYYDDAIIDEGLSALQTFGSWLGILVVIMLAAVIFGLFKYFGAGGSEAQY